MRPSIRLGRPCTAGPSLKSSVEGHFRPEPSCSIRKSKALSQSDNIDPPYGAVIPNSDSHILTIGALIPLNCNRNSDNGNRIPANGNPIPVNDKKFT
jgi:hypothetical protein